MPRPRIAIASAAEVMRGGEDEDQPVLTAALDQEGCEVVVWAWDDASVDWSSCDLVVIRSTWDYAARRDEFCAWVEATDRLAPLHNRPDVVSWNTDKHYLADLEAAGVPITPTTWIEPGSAPMLPEAAEVVVKPAISAGAKDTTRHDLHTDAEGARSAVDRLTAAGRSVMVQPYLEGVDTTGETGLVHIDGAFHHAFRKAPILVEGHLATERLYAPEQIAATEPTGPELALAADVLAAMPFDADDQLYARVDVAPGPDGRPVLMELELVEPSLFFVACNTPPTALVTAILDRV